MTSRPTPSSDRIAGIVTWTAIVAAAALIVVMVVMAHDTEQRRGAAANHATTSAVPDTTSFPRSAGWQPEPGPGGPPEVRRAADQILAAYNQRDSAPLQAWACDRTAVTDELFTGFSDTVTFTRDGAPRIVGFTAAVPFVVSDSGRQRAGTMRLRWDGNRWCFVTAVSELDREQPPPSE